MHAQASLLPRRDDSENLRQVFVYPPQCPSGVARLPVLFSGNLIASCDTALNQSVPRRGYGFIVVSQQGFPTYICFVERHFQPVGALLCSCGNYHELSQQSKLKFARFGLPMTAKASLSISRNARTWQSSFQLRL